MGKKNVSLAILAGFAIVWAAPAVARDVFSLDADWRFFRGDVSGAEQPRVDDSHWQVVQVPHDWTVDSPGDISGSVGWYRKRFALRSEDLGRRVFVEFDGVLHGGDFWINGMHLDHCTNGAAGVRYELPGYMLGFGNGTNNVLSVCATPAPLASPAVGGGIYRHVRLVIADPVHLLADVASIKIPKVSTAEANVQVATVVTNESDAPHVISVQTRLLAADGELVGAIESSQVIQPLETADFDQEIVFPNPRWWTLEDPKLYRAVRKLRVDGVVSDELSKAFVIRTTKFDGGDEFSLNGKNLKLHAVTVYPDGGAFGAAVPLSLWEARLRTLKMLGANAVRPAANPPSADFLALCDRLGMVVLDESSGVPAVAEGASDLGVDVSSNSAGDRELLDRTGAIRPLGRQRQSQWTAAPMVAVFRQAPHSAAASQGGESAAATWCADWTPRDLKPHSENVEACSNCKEVELFLNGKSLGKKTNNAAAPPRNWQVQFAPGILKAVARGGPGRSAATNELRTAGKPLKIFLDTDTTALSSAWDDVAIVRATVADAKGITVPVASDVISFRISGPGAIAAVDNADRASHQIFQTNSCAAFQGRCVAFLRANGTAGTIKLTATAPGLKPASISLKTAP